MENELIKLNIKLEELLALTRVIVLLKFSTFTVLVFILLNLTGSGT